MRRLSVGAMRRGVRVAIYQALACFLVVALAGAFAPSSGAVRGATLDETVTYTDEQNDSGTFDIASVDITGGADGRLVIQISTPDLGAVPQSAVFRIALDTDQNAQTGDTRNGGIEWNLAINAYGVAAYRWDGTTYARATLPSLTGYVGVRPTFQLQASDLGDPAGFNFWVEAVSDNSSNPLMRDFAPDRGMWNYTPQSANLKLLLGYSSSTKPRAGRAWSVFVEAIRSDSHNDLADEGTITCTARLAGRSLKPLVKGFLPWGRTQTFAICSWMLPKSARNHVVTASLSAAYESSSVGRSFRATVH
jgi:hypothetical protein